jgi:hypothetical protein
MHSHPFVCRMCPRVLMMFGVGGIHFDFVEMATRGVVGPKIFVMIVVIVLEKSQNWHVRQFKSAQGAARIR